MVLARVNGFPSGESNKIDRTIGEIAA